MEKSNVKWTIEKIKAGFESFYKEHDRYPTSVEIDAYKKLPSSRQIQRVFGGLPALRKQLKLSGQTDFTTGAHSSERARTIAERAHKLENEVYTYLVDTFGKPFVHREFFFTDDKRNRTDFYVYYKGGNFSVDVFYPQDKRSLSGCINSKMRNYFGYEQIQYPVIFLMMNDDIPEEYLETLLERKVNKLYSYQKLMTFNQLKKFCSGKGRASA